MKSYVPSSRAYAFFAASTALLMTVSIVRGGTALAASCVHPQGGVSIDAWGDVNDSGQVNVTDAVCCILAALAEQASEPLSGVSCLSGSAVAADVSCDGSINTVDITAVINLSLDGSVPSGLMPGGDGCPAACAPCQPTGLGSCLIGGSCVPEGQRIGTDGCQVCVPSVDATAYSTEVCTTYYRDDDDDTYGVTLDSVCDCLGADPYDTTDSGDCNDSDEDISPDAMEVCNGVDDDCNGQTDEISCGVLSSGSDCQTILAANSTAMSGSYTIDPDGPGGLAPFDAYCDMETDGGGWTVFYGVTGGNDEEPLVSNVAASGNPLAFQAFNLTQAQKMAIARRASQSIFVRPGDIWMRAETPAFDDDLGTSGTTREYPTTVTTSNGTTTSARLGYTTGNITGGGDFGIVANTFDHHAPNNYQNLNGSCAGHYLYSYSNGVPDSDAGYDVNTALGDWTNPASGGCESGEGGALAFYAAMRGEPSGDGTMGSPAYDCSTLQRTNPSSMTGTYFIKPRYWGGAPVEVYCDMDTDGGGWTILYAATGVNGETNLVADATVVGNPLMNQHYNRSRALKVAVSRDSDETLFARSSGVWLQTDAGPYSPNLNQTINQQDEWAVNLESSNGTTTTGLAGHTNYQFGAGGDYGIVINNFDNHSSIYRMLNSGCAQHYLYSYSHNGPQDNDAGYDVNTGLGDWAATSGCHQAEGGLLQFYMGARRRAGDGTAGNPAEDCRTLLNDYPDTPSGTYFIKPAAHASTEFQVYCDMTTEGGGWTLAAYHHTVKPDYLFSSYQEILAGAVEPAVGQRRALDLNVRGVQYTELLYFMDDPAWSDPARDYNGYWIGNSASSTYDLKSPQCQLLSPTSMSQPALELVYHAGDGLNDNGCSGGGAAYSSHSCDDGGGGVTTNNNWPQSSANDSLWGWNCIVWAWGNNSAANAGSYQFTDLAPSGLHAFYVR